MNKTFTNVLIFTAGAAIGSLVTWKVVKTRYERIAQEEIDSVKETWARLGQDAEEQGEDENPNECDSDDLEESEEADPVMTDYVALAKKYGRSSDEVSDNEKKGEGDEVPYINGPYVITPEDYGDGNYDHDLYCLTYYSDNVLANDWWETLDIEDTIGTECLEHFGDYAEDIVHVRNERLKADYEIVRDYRTYAELIENDPLRRTYED